METAGAIAIFGAAVRADGRPSAALARRIGYGAEAARRWPQALVFCSGAAGRHGPSEASVMGAALVAQGVASDRIVLDEISRDTLQSTDATAALVRAQGAARVVVCSDRYHIPRIRLLLGALGVESITGPLAPGRGGARPAYWLKMCLREVVAIPYDLGIVLARRLWRRGNRTSVPRRSAP